MFTDFPIAGEFYKEISTSIDDQDTVNLYNIFDKKGKKPYSMAGTPGTALTKILQLGSDPTRLLFQFDGQAYSVAGANVYSLDNTFIATSIGTLGTNTGPVFAIGNTGATQTLFVDGQKGYWYDTVGGSFNEITASGFPTQPTCCTWLDAFAIVTGGESNLFYISAPNDFSTWDPLRNRAQAFARAGNLVGCAVVDRKLFLFKTDSIEVWRNAGAADFPLRRDNNMLFNYGCASVGSIASDLGLLFWLASDSSGVGSIMMSDGHTPVPISTPAVDKLIQSFLNPADAKAYIYKNDDGNIFYIINWTTDDQTLLYNHSAPEGYQWTRLKRQGSPLKGQTTRHIGDCHMYFNDRHYIGSYNSPLIYEMSMDYGDDAGIPIKRERIAQTFSDPTYKKIRGDMFQVDFQMGIGNIAEPYRNPQVYLSISRDGGVTFGNEKPATLGRLGERTKRAIWRKLGITRGTQGFIFKISVYADVKPIRILGAAIKYEGLRA